jgi:hypothetical protein
VDADEENTLVMCILAMIAMGFFVLAISPA